MTKDNDDDEKRKIPSVVNATSKADMSKPVKVFILMGQSNMLGFGFIPGGQEGCLEYTVKTKKLYPHLVQKIDDKGKIHWTTLTNQIRNVGVMQDKGKMQVNYNNWLTVKGSRFGPDLEIGHVLAHALQDDDSPILLLKSCIGNRSLGWDLLPPGSERYDYQGYTYAGYKDSPDRWKKGTEPVPIAWYAGKQYDDDTRNAKEVLDNLPDYYPGAEAGYEIAGFFFWQGHKDTGNPAHAMRYEQNLVRFIESVRTDFNAPQAKFVCATVAFGGYDMKGNTLKVAESQLAMNDSTKYPQFDENVKTVDVRASWRSTGPAKRTSHHYFGHAETYLEVGDKMGRAMVDLLKQQCSAAAASS